MSGGRFAVMELDVKTNEGADKVAAALAYKKTSEFNHCEYTIVEISDRERLAKRGLFGRTYFKEKPDEQSD